VNAPTQVDPFAWWRLAIAGKAPTLNVDDPPKPGFYRSGPFAVAYWYKDGALKCRVNDKPVGEQDALEKWPFASKKPVTHEAYTARIESGEWASECPAVTEDIRIARNPEANTFVGLRKRIEVLQAAAEAMMKAGGAKTQESADAAADLTDRLSKLWKQSDGLRTVEKQPHLDASRDVDDKWRPLLAGAALYKSIKAVVTDPWLKHLDREKAKALAEAQRVADAARAAAEAASRKIDELAPNANDGESNALVIDAAKAADATAQAAAANVERVANTKVTAGTRGRVTHLRKVDVVTITHRALLLAHFSEREEITAVLQTLAERAVAAGQEVPGVTVTKEGAAA
jgi:hypothetical protein